MRHRSRVKCHREYCDLLEEQLRKECERTKKTSNAFIAIEWKMKFEQMSSRETMPEILVSEDCCHGMVSLLSILYGMKCCR